jgi:hypothetical protein
VPGLLVLGIRGCGIGTQWPVPGAGLLRALGFCSSRPRPRRCLATPWLASGQCLLVFWFWFWLLAAEGLRAWGLGLGLGVVVAPACWLLALGAWGLGPPLGHGAGAAPGPGPEPPPPPAAPPRPPPPVDPETPGRGRGEGEGEGATACHGEDRRDQLRDHTGQKRRYWLVLKEIIRAAPCFFLRVLAWY